ncbi:MAG: hypothetical protein K2J26_01915 [Ruminococcus sp.]|nr:hypothetical protein [Ruminococcus sp.]
MGGRGSSSGISDKGKPYGTEYTTLYKSGNIKFIKKNEGSSTAPMETMTRGRVYVTVDNKGDLKAITYHDNLNKRNRQIDLDKPHRGMKPHTHHGYIHNENDSEKGAANLTTEERQMVDRITKIWYNRDSK